MPEISRLDVISPREAWKDEARDFTPWLAEHLEELGSAIGMPIEYEGQEVSVENFSADILARNPMTDSRVLIENQLEKSDHKHLGQLLTYLAGLEAEVVVWVATHFTEPHLAAIKWLNEHTVEPYSFFAVRLSVVRIQDSPLAPMFQVLEQPNSWERQTQASARAKVSASGRAKIREEFWSTFLDRHPEFSNRGVKVNGAASQWLAPLQAKDLFVSVYFAVNGVGVFLRGARGTSPSEIYRRFEPVSQKFLELAVVDEEYWGADESRHPGVGLKLDTSRKENWDQAIEWLSAVAGRWLRATDLCFEDV